MSGHGVLPCQQIEALIAAGAVSGTPPVTADQVQPASLDLRLGTVAYRLRASFLAGAGRAVADRLGEMEMHRFSLDGGAVLERGCVYLVPLMEQLALPAEVHAVTNAKSSTGRLDILTRTITDGGTEFDRVAQGYRGPLYAEICPRSFSVLVRPGLALNQIRFRRGAAGIADTDLARRQRQEGLVSGEGHVDGGLSVSVDLSPGQGVVGYRAKPHTGLVDLSRTAAHPAAAFWERLDAGDGRLVLDPGAFYILKSREAISIPPDCAAEMAPYLAMVGEFRVHYAGFFDPGFGHPAAGGAGARGVLEVRCHEVPFVLEHAQSVGRLVFETMAEAPARLYGAAVDSNYQGQGLKLSKHFAEQDARPGNED